MKAIFLILTVLCFAGCYQSHADDDLRGVPVTNNPNLLPKSGQTAQGMPF